MPVNSKNNIKKNTSKPTDEKMVAEQNNCIQLDDVKVTEESPNDRIKKLEDQISQLTEIMKMMMGSQNKEEPVTKEDLVTEVNEEIEYAEPNPNKQIRIVSLCYGSLNLSTEPFGKGRLLSFSKYGESKMVLYSTLIDIVNNNRKFAEQGLFYILDKDAVYYLGLSEFYKNIIPIDSVDKIFNYSTKEIESMLSNINDSQKQSIAHTIADKMYAGIDFDLNKVSIIDKCCGTDIIGMVREMKEMNESLKGNK